MSVFDAIARDLSFGASGWVDEARLVGNVTARQIIMLCRHVLEQTKHVKKLEAENAELRAQVPKVVRPKNRYVDDHYEHVRDYTTRGTCPECNEGVRTSDVFCRECGAKLDWSEVAP